MTNKFTDRTFSHNPGSLGTLPMVPCKLLFCAFLQAEIQLLIRTGAHRACSKLIKNQGARALLPFSSGFLFSNSVASTLVMKISTYTVLVKESIALSSQFERPRLLLAREPLLSRSLSCHHPHQVSSLRRQVLASLSLNSLAFFNWDHREDTCRRKRNKEFLFFCFGRRKHFIFLY